MEDELLDQETVVLRLRQPQGFFERLYWIGYRFLHSWFTYSEWRYRIRFRLWGFFQRGWRGWADRDVWGFDSYLAGVTAAGLRRLEATRHGYPVEFLPDYQTRWDHTSEESDAASAAWGRWLIDKAEWLEWYHLDEDGVSDDKGWIREDLSEEEKSRRITAHQEQIRRFYEEVLPDLAKHWGSLWD